MLCIFVCIYVLVCRFRFIKELCYTHQKWGWIQQGGKSWEKSIAGRISNADEGGFVLPPNIVDIVDTANIVESQRGDADTITNADEGLGEEKNNISSVQLLF